MELPVCQNHMFLKHERCLGNMYMFPKHHSPYLWDITKMRRYLLNMRDVSEKLRITRYVWQKSSIKSDIFKKHLSIKWYHSWYYLVERCFLNIYMFKWYHSTTWVISYNCEMFLKHVHVSETSLIYVISRTVHHLFKRGRCSALKLTNGKAKPRTISFHTDRNFIIL